jgi:sugar phosphate isomerase/epimerase
MPPAFTRRQLLSSAAVSTALAAAAPVSEAIAEETRITLPKVKYCLNTSTIRGQKIPLADEVELAAKAGYGGIEPWMNEIQQFVNQGGKLDDLRKKIADLGLTVESAIGFAEWIVDDDERRQKGLEQARRDMDQVRQLGGTRIAAPPAGATKQADLNLNAAGERFAKLLDLGRETGVTPQLEVWGFSACLSKLSEVLYVAAAAGHPQAIILPDVYHLHKGGSSFHSLKLLAGAEVQVFHMNDYPAEPPRAEIKDADRVHCGDGVAPLREILRTMFANGFAGTLSLELFNPNYYQQDAAEVLKTGLQKMKDAVLSAAT